MAEATPMSSASEDIWDRMRAEITQAFDKLIAKAKSRRDELLSEVVERKRKFEKRYKTQIESLSELEKILTQIQQTNKKMTTQLLETSLVPIEKQISELKSTLRSASSFRFGFSHTDLFRVSKLGAIVEKTCYSSKDKAIRVLGSFHDPKSLYIDRSKPKLYVSDSADRSVKIFDSMKSLHAEFSLEEYCPLCVVTTKQFVYVAVSKENRYYLQMFDKSNFRLQKTADSTGGSFKHLKRPLSMAVTPDEDILIADCGNNRVCVMDGELFYRREMGVGLLKKLSCVQVRENLVYALDKKLLQVFNTSGERVDSLSFTLLRYPLSFCFDSAGNVLFTDNLAAVKILSPQGDQLHQLGGTPEGEDVTGCCSVAMHEDTIVVCCAEPLNLIKLF